MNVLLINIDSVKLPNLALEKIARHHYAKGDDVQWNLPLIAHQVDRIYVSCVFSKNADKARQFEAYPHALIGGTGYDPLVKLPDEIEAIEPRINLGFTTRGCIRNCSFCLVPKKEGTVRIVGDLYSIWDGKSKDVTLLDNNILAEPEHFFKICAQARQEGIRLDFNQGLDHRLLTPEIAHELKRTRLKEYRFAYDSPDLRERVDKAIDMLKDAGINEAIWYVLTGYDTTIWQDLNRLNHLRERGHLAFLQRYEMRPELIPLARWANQRQLFRGLTFAQFLRKAAKARYYINLYGAEMYDKLLEAGA